jgi:hemolysin activation/secretion protein
MTAFTESELSDIYQGSLQQTITLDYIWDFANQITQRYQDKGYFLSRANIPQQEIENGIVEIEIIEGYIAEVDLNKKLAERVQIKQLISRLKDDKPTNAYNLESFMLQMNALPGQQFRAIIEPIKGVEQGQVKLSLIPKEQKAQYSAAFNNYGSLFLGPYQMVTNYQGSFFPLQQTTLSLFTSLPADELKSVAFNHSIPLYPNFRVDLFGDYVNAYPGDSLEILEIESKSSSFGAKLSWQPIRQRLENLVTSFELSGKNTDSYILQDVLQTQDRIRAIRVKLNYDVTDSFNGYNYLFFSINQGMKIFNSSDQGDSYLSRSEAEPDFTTLQFDYTRQQSISSTFMIVTQLLGQIASAPLFSSEEFGYGGQVFGRAYDPSEITGDDGVSASIELRYLGISSWKQNHLTPYAFYDIGKVWNKDSGGVSQSAASSGLAIDWIHASGFNAQIGIAWPLTRNASNPIHGDGTDPKLLLQLSYQNR